MRYQPFFRLFTIGLLVTFVLVSCAPETSSIPRVKWLSPAEGTWFQAGDTASLEFEIFSEAEVAFTVTLINAQNTPVAYALERFGKGVIQVDYAIPQALQGSGSTFYFRVRCGAVSGFREVNISMRQRQFKEWAVVTNSVQNEHELWTVSPTEVALRASFQGDLSGVAVAGETAICAFRDGGLSAYSTDGDGLMWSVNNGPSPLGKEYMAIASGDDGVVASHADGRLLKYNEQGHLLLEQLAFENRYASLLQAGETGLFACVVPRMGQSGLPGIEMRSSHQLIYLGGTFLGAEVQKIVPMTSERIYLFWNDLGAAQFASYKPSEQGLESFYSLPSEPFVDAIQVDANSVWISLESGIYVHRYNPAHFGQVVPSSSHPWHALAAEPINGYLAAANSRVFNSFNAAGQQLEEHVFQDTITHIIPIYTYE